MKLLLHRLIPVRQVKFPVEGGMGPTILLASKSKIVTCLPEGLHVTPI